MFKVIMIVCAMNNGGVWCAHDTRPMVNNDVQFETLEECKNFIPLEKGKVMYEMLTKKMWENVSGKTIIMGCIKDNA